MSHQSAGQGRGFLIVFEGIDGVGKTTHAHRLAASLRGLGWQVEVRKEPTDGPHGKRLRQSGETGRMSAAEELELFLKDRREHVDTQIEPGLAAGKIMILDRYYFSTMAYQGARGFDPEEIRRQNEQFAPRPDCLLIMTAPLGEALGRINERYFQIARCFRDEDLRADRQPEFTQIDIEASFTSPDEIIALIEGMFGEIFKQTLGRKIPATFDRITYREAMDRYGSDKPDRRIGFNLKDLSDVFAASEFKVFSGAIKAGGCVKAINVKGFSNISVGQVDKLTELAKEAGAKGLAYIQVRGDDPSGWRSPITKFFSEQELNELREKMEVEAGDLILFAAGEWQLSCEILGRIRLACADLLDLPGDTDELNFLWVTDFPLLAFDPEENRWNAVHHPFTRPHPDDVRKLEAGDYQDIRAMAYDVVLNGYELGGGSIRIHEAELQQKMFTALGINPDQAKNEFGHILEAFSFGAPPHGGIALGLDRLVMLIAGESSIREVIAFPKNNRGQDVMSNSPAQATPNQLRDVYIQTKTKAQQ